MAQRSDKPIKVCLTNRGAESETPWALDLGAAAGKKGSRKVRLVNVPFLHAKPTWGDVIVVSPVADGLPTWDREGVAWKDIGTRIVEDGGRWAMIVDYTPHPGDATGDAAYEALARACQAADIVCEGAWGPNPTKPGRTYLAVRDAVTAERVMAALRDAELPCELVQVHPAPAAASGVRRPASGGTKKTTTAKAKAKPKTTSKTKPKTKARR